MPKRIKSKKELEQEELGNQYIRAREKARARGASKEEANIIAEGKSQSPSRTVEEVRGNKEAFIRDLRAQNAGDVQITAEPKQPGILSRINKGLPGVPPETGTITGDVKQSLGKFANYPLAQFIAAGAGGGIAAAYRVGGETLAGAKAVQAANFLKNSVKARGILVGLRDFGIGAYASLKAAEGVAGYFIGRKIDEQQQALNTLGQITSTIVGDSTSGTGDWRKGLAELNYIRSEIIRLESAIKSGAIQNASIRFNGKIYDINADIYDQLATINEGIADIRTFALSGEMPELSEYELQALVRQYEEEGLLEPVDLAAARRETE